MNFLRKNWFWFLLVFIVFLAGIKIVGPYYLKYLAKDQPQTELPKSLFAPTTSKPNDNSIAPVEVKNADEYKGSVVRYKESGFSPSQIKLEEDGTGFGCLLKIINDSKDPLIVRLGPYEMSVKSNYGFKYDPIPPGGNILIDPRFGRRTEEILNFNRPQDKFLIEFGPACVAE
ncbi:MAG: hypothetical protein Q8R29_00160 [bacterium]|nr:hypothetical protein [bacterium]